MALTREQAAAGVAAAAAQRDSIQANLLDLDGSFGRRLLAGATLTGLTKQRWEAASADLTALWDTFSAYNAVIERAAGILARSRRSSEAELAEITTLLTGRSVTVTHGPAPLGQRSLTDSGRSDLSLATAVSQMTAAFARVAEVVTAAENVWNAASDAIDRVTAALAPARAQAQGLGDPAVTQQVAMAEAELARQRDALNADPFALLSGGTADTSQLERLARDATALASRVAEMARLRQEAESRIAVAARAVAAVQAAERDAREARDRAAEKIVAGALPPMPATAAMLAGRLATLGTLKNAGQWSRLADEISAIERQAADAARGYADAAQAAAALLRRRTELRGLLDAYQAKAAVLGAAEDSGLTGRYRLARDLLWTAPCDITAAADAVAGYQQAILALGERGRRR